MTLAVAGRLFLLGDPFYYALASMAVGIHVFFLYLSRGLQSTSRDQSRLSTMANLADALAALRLLATHPRMELELALGDRVVDLVGVALARVRVVILVAGCAG